MLVDDIKARMFSAMKAGRSVEKEILRVVLGELQTAAVRENREPDDQAVFGVVKKLIKSNDESLSATADDAQRSTLLEENEVLKSLLPEAPTSDAIRAALEPVISDIRAAKNTGQATGIAMKSLREAAVAADGKDVAAVVRSVRGE